MRLLLLVAVLIGASAASAEDLTPNLPTVIVKKGEGRVERVMDNGGVVTEIVYDNKGNMVSKTTGVGTANVATWMYCYDKYGRVVTEVDPRGNKTQYAYKNLASREPLQVCLPDGTIQSK